MALPVEILLGVYVGILTGILPGLVAWGLGFIVKYLTGVTIPGFGVVVLSLAIAGVNGGLLALADETILSSATATTTVTAIVVVVMIALYAHARGDAMGATFPKRVSLRGLRERTLSSEAVELVGGRGQVRVRVTGEVVDMEGYPPLGDDARQAIKDGEWTLPADIPLSELEDRFGERLRTEFDLADVAVTIDELGRATVVAAPPLSGLSKRVPTGERAVSVDALVPTGVARGDEVELSVADGTVRGTVVSARSGEPGTGSGESPTGPGGVGTDGSPVPDGGEVDDEDVEPPPQHTPTTSGGDGRLTVSVPRSEADRLLRATRPKVVVLSRGTRREYELLSLLRRSGKRFRKLTVRAGGALDGATLGTVSVRESHGVAVLAVRRPDGWVLAPGGDTELSAGDDLFAVGTRDALDGFVEVAA